MSKDSNKKLAFSVFILFCSMLILSFAAAPIYSLFCKATGFAGTTSKNEFVSSNKVQKGKRIIKVEFDANIEKSLPWRFWPKNKPIELKVGEIALIFYEAHSNSDQDIKGTAIYNISPQKAGKYFVKVNCFCFEEQILKAHQKALLPVSFYIDKSIEDDPEMDDVFNITLSYSFFKI